MNRMFDGTPAIFSEESTAEDFKAALHILAKEAFVDLPFKHIHVEKVGNEVLVEVPNEFHKVMDLKDQFQEFAQHQFRGQRTLELGYQQGNDGKLRGYSIFSCSARNLAYTINRIAHDADEHKGFAPEHPESLTHRLNHTDEVKNEIAFVDPLPEPLTQIDVDALIKGDMTVPPGLHPTLASSGHLFSAFKLLAEKGLIDLPLEKMFASSSSTPGKEQDLTNIVIGCVPSAYTDMKYKLESLLAGDLPEGVQCDDEKSCVTLEGSIIANTLNRIAGDYDKTHQDEPLLLDQFTKIRLGKGKGENE